MVTSCNIEKGLIECYGVEFVDKLETDSITKKEFTSSQNRTGQKIKCNDILNVKTNILKPAKQTLRKGME
jgi:hypothetical protein